MAVLCRLIGHLPYGSHFEHGDTIVECLHCGTTGVFGEDWTDITWRPHQ